MNGTTAEPTMTVRYSNENDDPICPFFSTQLTHTPCLREKCAWYVERWGFEGCAMKLAAIAQYLR